MNRLLIVSFFESNFWGAVYKLPFFDISLESVKSNKSIIAYLVEITIL